jgi:hypothetical protein
MNILSIQRLSFKAIPPSTKGVSFDTKVKTLSDSVSFTNYSKKNVTAQLNKLQTEEIEQQTKGTNSCYVALASMFTSAMLLPGSVEVAAGTTLALTFPVVAGIATTVLTVAAIIKSVVHLKNKIQLEQEIAKLKEQQ